MSVNKVILLGYTGKDPEVKDVAGTKVANLSLATTEKGYTPSKRDPSSGPHGMA